MFAALTRAAGAVSGISPCRWRHGLVISSGSTPQSIALARQSGAPGGVQSKPLDPVLKLGKSPHERSMTMPFVRIDLKRGKPPEYRKILGEIVYKAMIDLINVPHDDKFQVITEHDRDDLNFAQSYLGNRYSEDIVFIQITLNAGRSVELKKAFYKRIVDEFQQQLHGRPDDVVINLVEVPKENWSFGHGLAQYAS
jgi:4-oxalocrotonate tautomerase